MIERWKYFFIILITLCQLVNSSNFTQIFQILSPKTELTGRKFNQYFKHPRCMENWHRKQPYETLQKMNKVLSQVKSFLLNGCPTSKMAVITGNRVTMLRSLGHFPHYADIFFSFYSILLWQNHTYRHELDQTPSITRPCIHHFLINQSYLSVWKKLATPRMWITELTTAINTAFGENLLVTELLPSEYKHTKIPVILTNQSTDLKFYHPSDALLLTNALLNRDPCYYHRKAAFLQSKPIKIMIITRKARGLLNQDEIVSTIQQFSFHHSSLFPKGISISLHNFDNYSFLRQVEVMSETDIVIAAHGAALTNLVFLKPCSVVLEILPWLYPAHHFFRGFARSAGVLHYEWMEGMNNTIHEFSRSSNQSQKCLLLLQKMKIKQLQVPYRETYFREEFHSPQSLSYECGLMRPCRVCARAAKGMIVRQSKLKQILATAIEDRLTCIQKNPFYTT